MKILVVDDHAYNRDLLTFILEEEGHAIVEAEDGQRACDLFGSDLEIELILMDVNMPVLDGISATKCIKSQNSDRFTPVIFITALDDAEMVAKCLEAGGDDFVPKPVNENVLLAKINAHGRSCSLFKSLQEANKKLEYHKKLMDREHTIVEQVFANCAYRVETTCDNLEQYSSPMSLFNGDLLLFAPSPSGGMYFIVGDFTGHGLSAAVGSLPVSEIFFSHISRQASVARIASQINARLHGLLPRTMFFCAAIGHLDRNGKTLSLWSGGMNDILRLAPNADAPEHISASHMPLGILPEAEFDDGVDVIDVASGEMFVIHTDGVNEACDSEGTEFGLDRLEAVVSENRDNVVEAVKNAVSDFHSGGEQSDDISIMSLVAGPLVHRDRVTSEIMEVGDNYFNVRSFPWRFSMHLGNEDLQCKSAANQVLDIMATIKGIAVHLDKIFTIISELYSNALEHGVLRLDSDLKKQVDGFELYYRLREQRLKEIKNQFIKVDIRYIQGQPDAIEIIMEDSGGGFDISRIGPPGESGDNSFGRGLQLLRHLCSSLEYSKSGSRVRAVYDLYLD
ncbi:MAG: fused response regulator/phosphatase [Cellvibrionaceae bacterium]|nr:fused response regulator/phosphatase [Cellvibrionaceae bacterium]